MAYQVEGEYDGTFFVRFTYRRKPKLQYFETVDAANAFIRFLERRDRAKARRRATDDVYRSCNMTRVRGALGGTYYE